MKNVKLTYCRITDDGKITWPVIEMDAFELMKDWYNECRVCPENEATVKSCIMDGVELVGNGLDRKPRVEFYDAIAYIESHHLFPDAMLEKLAKEGFEFRRDILDLNPKLVYMAKNEHVRAEIGTSSDHFVKIIRDCDNYPILDDRDYSLSDDIKDSEIVLRKVAGVADKLDKAIDDAAIELADYEIQ
jgi:hypothetical protein